MEKYDVLNKEQAEAVDYTEGPLLILAGAGSGKTKVLTHRTAHLIEDCGVNPYQILAITFTNKAADEMRERIDAIVGFGSESIWVATFHSTCVRILRRFIDRIGYENHFSIYDTDDQKSVMKEICKRKHIDTKIYKERSFLNAISAAKNELRTPADVRADAEGNYGLEIQAEVYKEYQSVLKKNNALDFDDLIMKCVELLQRDEEVRDYYQNRFRYIMVDEYQDTNTAQFQLVRLLAGKYKNLCVVGDDDQSIYKFRGANIRNILHFEKHYPDAHVIRLEQNYRSTQNILDAANAVIRNNTGRREKALWTEKKGGDKLTYRQLDTAYDEAYYIAKDITQAVRDGLCGYKDCAVLYRTNAQSRLLEEKMVAFDVPYRIIGGINFYSRKEIKDLLAYLKTIDNGDDDLAVTRIINVPKRGIGAVTINKIQAYADAQGITFWEACCRVEQIPSIGKASAKICAFTDFIRLMKTRLKETGIRDTVEYLIDASGYLDSFANETEEEIAARTENIDEFISKIADYEESTDEPLLSDFLDQVSLVADIDAMDDARDYVALMTLHSAKGLEFPRVYMAGMEDGLFPGYVSIMADDAEELEEERRLCYVGITRAKEHLTFTCAKTRMVRGEMQYARTSRFLEEIPPELFTLQGQRPEKKKSGYARSRYDADGGGSYGSRGSAYGNTQGSGSSYGGGTHGSSYRDGSRSVSRSGSPRTSGAGGSNTVDSYDAYRVKRKPSKDFGSGASLKDPGYTVGDRVAHKKFGEGIVTALQPGGRDYEVTVDFDTAGTKKMFASFANMHKV